MSVVETTASFANASRVAVFTNGYPDWDHPEVLQLLYRKVILPDERNPRQHENQGDMQDLIDSIRQDGIREAIKVRRANPEIDRDPRDPKAPVENLPIAKSGHRRMFAADVIQLELVPCELDPRIMPEADIVRELIVHNEHGVKPPPIDRARSYDRYMRLKGYNQAQTARDLKVSQMEVSTILRLLTLPIETQNHINRREIAITTGVWLSKLEASKQEILRLTTEIVEGRMIGKKIRGMVREQSKARAAAARSGGSSASHITGPSTNGHASGYAPKRLSTHRSFSVGNQKRVQIMVSCDSQQLTDEDIANCLEEAKRSLFLEMPVHHAQS